jgi:hypothetical protein
MGDSSYQSSVYSDIETIRNSDPVLANLINSLENSPNPVFIGPDMSPSDGPETHALDPQAAQNGKGTGSFIEYSPNNTMVHHSDQTTLDPRSDLTHEFQHSSDIDQGGSQNAGVKSPGSDVDINEVRASQTQNIFNQSMGYPPRTLYDNRDICDPNPGSSPAAELPAESGAAPIPPGWYWDLPPLPGQFNNPHIGLPAYASDRKEQTGSEKETTDGQ